MDYTLAEVKLKVNQLSDKMGSDYFVLPTIMTFFQTATLNFVGERLKHIEKTNTISDDIASLIDLGVSIDIVPDLNDPTKYVAPLPSDYLGQVAFDVFYDDNTRCRRADKMRHAEYNMARQNPNRKPTKHYPIILQFGSLFQIDAGVTVPKTLSLTYAKKPKFAELNESNTRIVNLPDIAIEQILKTTVTELFNKTADERTTSSYQFQEAYRKIFR